MKVLVVSNMYPSEKYPVYGAFVARQVEALRRAGVEVEVAGNLEQATGPLTNLVKYARLRRRSLQAAGTGNFDVVHAHYLYPTAIIGEWASARAHAPLVLTAHGDDVRNAAASRMAGRIRKALSRADAVVGVSKYLAGQLEEKFSVDPERITIIDCGVDTDLFRPMARAETRSRLDLPIDAKIVLFAGYLHEKKGISTLLAAHRKLLVEGREVLLVVVGDGPLAPQVEAAARDGVTRGWVRPVGQVRHERMSEWFSSADVVSVPSNREAFGLVALEAMACGVPVVASEVGGLPEIVASDRNGLLVPAAHPDRLAEAIGRALDPDRATAYAEAARQTACRHSLDDQTGKLADLYARVVS